ncbi:MAG: O-antigen ligase family protein, partial [Planctomycetes bacterium]|nr:O-antigen ligase family protein [Planctomycetota bacterium]
ALAAGLVLIVVRAVPSSYRRSVVLVAIATGLLAVLLVGRPWLKSQQAVGAGGRGASLRLRLHTWQYAQDLFFAKPLAGHGQGSYFLLAQQMASVPRREGDRPDVEKDPTAFNAGLVGHAHSEWLEILADLGAIGFALMASSLGLTFWAGVRAFLRATAPAEKWCLLGLMVGLLAIVVEEFADVALRMPVLPIVFYTTIALIWALCLSQEAALPAGRPVLPDRLRPVGLLAVIFVAMMFVTAARRDWDGALADGRLDGFLQKQQWDAALQTARTAQQYRLDVQEIVAAAIRETGAAQAAAAHRLEQLRTMLARRDQLPPASRTNLRNLAQQDIEKFDGYLAECMQAGQRVWAIMPCAPSAAEWMAEVLLMKNEIEARKLEVGLEPIRQPFVQAARQWMLAEFQRDRFNAPVALRLLVLCRDQPIDLRLDLLRIPLRAGPQPVGIVVNFEAAVGQIAAAEPSSFEHRMETLRQAVTAAQAASDADHWLDPYAPETLRLQAMAAAAAGQHDQAAALAAEAVGLYENQKLRFYHPGALSYGLLDQARYQFLADADQPDKAVALCRRAIECWPEVAQREEQLRPLKRELALYLMAAGDEGSASDLLRQEGGPITDERLKRNVGYGLAEICGRFIGRAPTSRPARFPQWLSRSLELAPDYPHGHLLAAHCALEHNRGAEAAEHLKAMEAQVEDPRWLDVALETLAKHFPASDELKAYIASRAEAASRPTSEASEATQPAGGPVRPNSFDTRKPEHTLN